jgi:hypothetical protein
MERNNGARKPLFDLKNGKVPVNAQPLRVKASELIALINGGVVGGCSDSITSLSHIHNQIFIDRGTYLAKSPNALNYDWRIDSSTGNELLDLHVEMFFLFINAKRKTKVKVEMLDCVLANLFSAYNTNSQLLYSRDKNNKDYRTTIQVVDYLVANELVVNVNGKANEYQGNRSWMVATDKLIREFEKAKVKVALSNDASMVIVRDKKGNDKELNRIKTRQPLKLKEVSNPVQDYNRLWLSHDVTLGGKHIVPFCRRIFNESLDYGGRFYGASHLVIPSAEREHILIDEQPTIEPDFKSLHFTLLYAQVGIQLDPLNDDPYLVDGFDRKTIKLASLVLLNSENIPAFKGNITKSGNPKNKQVIAEYRKALELFILRSSQGLEAKEPRKPQIMKGFIDGMPDRIDGETLYTALCERHHAIAHLFGTEKIGVRLQNIDSQIMAKTIAQLTALDIPVLPVHDSLRCKVSDCETVTQAMKQSYKSVMCFDGCVTV